MVTSVSFLTACTLSTLNLLIPAAQLNEPVQGSSSAPPSIHVVAAVADENGRSVILIPAGSTGSGILKAVVDENGRPMILDAQSIEIKTPGSARVPLTIQRLKEVQSTPSSPLRHIQIQAVALPNHTQSKHDESGADKPAQLQSAKQRIQDLREKLVAALRSNNAQETAELREMLRRLMAETQGATEKSRTDDEARQPEKIVVREQRVIAEQAADRRDAETRRNHHNDANEQKHQHHEIHLEIRASDRQHPAHPELTNDERPGNRQQHREPEISHQEMEKRHQQHSDRQREMQHDMQRREIEIRNRHREQIEQAEHARHEFHGEMPDDSMRRAQALHQAAERLSDGGLHEMAQQLRRQAEEIERDFQNLQRIRTRTSGGDDHASGSAVRNLTEQVEQLRHDVRELHQKLERISQMLDRGQPHHPNR